MTCIHMFDALVDCAFIGPVLARHALVDDDDARIIDNLFRGERPAFDETAGDSIEEIGPNRTDGLTPHIKLMVFTSIRIVE
jgi:hypothetical protein